MDLPLDHIALVGYTFIFLFSLYKLNDTFLRPIDLIANVLLLIGLGSLMFYHYIRIKTHGEKNETNDAQQKQLRQMAHVSIATFFLITLLPISQSTFQLYDGFGLIAHSYLAYAVTEGANQLLGVGFLAIYFFLASYRKTLLDIGELGFDSLTLVGRLLLLFYFAVRFGNGVTPYLAAK